MLFFPKKITLRLECGWWKVGWGKEAEGILGTDVRLCEIKIKTGLLRDVSCEHLVGIEKESGDIMMRRNLRIRHWWDCAEPWILC